MPYAGEYENGVEFDVGIRLEGLGPARRETAKMNDLLGGTETRGQPWRMFTTMTLELL